MIREINGSLFSDMLISGANNLLNNRQKVDEMNVFPVPDGDTGTNMSMTMKACVPGLKAARDQGLSAVSKSVANDTLRGARGNSGVILSQLMRGIKKALTGSETCDVKLWAQALKSASDCAYRAVMKPTEGTILTVAREMGECAVKYAEEFEDFEQFLALIADAGNKALAKTPDLLPKLKQAGVVDSGGQGLMYIIEGMLYFVSKDKIIVLNETEEETTVTVSEEVTDIKFGYCTECIIDKKDKAASSFRFKATIEKIGDSMVIVDDDDIIKVHIHTNHPDVILKEALKLGTLASVKVENMRLQHSNLIQAKAEKQQAPKKKFAFVSVAAGDGLVDTLKKLGIDFVIQGGQTMNPSTEDILEAIEKLNAETIYVFPNNKNIILAAQQAKKLSKKNVIVIETSSVTQAMSCMLEFDEENSAKENSESFTAALTNVKSAQITYAVRDTTIDNIAITEGDYIGIVDGKIKIVDKTIDTAVCDALEQMVDDDTGVITLFYGSDTDESSAKDLLSVLKKKYADCDVFLHNGGQPVYNYYISVE